MLRALASSLASLALATLAASALAAQNPHYHVVKRVVLGHTRADYIIVDPVGRRLYG